MKSISVNISVNDDRYYENAHIQRNCNPRNWNQINYRHKEKATNRRNYSNANHFQNELSAENTPKYAEFDRNATEFNPKRRKFSNDSIISRRRDIHLESQNFMRHPNRIFNQQATYNPLQNSNAAANYVIGDKPNYWRRNHNGYKNHIENANANSKEANHSSGNYNPLQNSNATANYVIGDKPNYWRRNHNGYKNHIENASANSKEANHSGRNYNLLQNSNATANYVIGDKPNYWRRNHNGYKNHIENVNFNSKEANHSGRNYNPLQNSNATANYVIGDKPNYWRRNHNGYKNHIENASANSSIHKQPNHSRGKYHPFENPILNINANPIINEHSIKSASSDNVVENDIENDSGNGSVYQQPNDSRGNYHTFENPGENVNGNCIVDEDSMNSVSSDNVLEIYTENDSANSSIYQQPNHSGGNYHTFENPGANVNGNSIIYQEHNYCVSTNIGQTNQIVYNEPSQHNNDIESDDYIIYCNEDGDIIDTEQVGLNGQQNTPTQTSSNIDNRNDNIREGSSSNTNIGQTNEIVYNEPSQHNNDIESDDYIIYCNEDGDIIDTEQVGLNGQQNTPTQTSSNIDNTNDNIREAPSSNTPPQNNNTSAYPHLCSNSNCNEQIPKNKRRLDHNKKYVCNACGLYSKSHKEDRPYHLTCKIRCTKCHLRSKYDVNSSNRSVCQKCLKYGGLFDTNLFF